MDAILNLTCMAPRPFFNSFLFKSEQHGGLLFLSSEQQARESAYEILSLLAACTEAFSENFFHGFIEGLQALF